MTQHQTEPTAEPTESLILIHVDGSGGTHGAKCELGGNHWVCRSITAPEKYRHPFRFPPDVPADSTIRALVVAMYRNEPAEPST